MTMLFKSAMVLMAAAVVAGCGSSGGDSTPPPPPVVVAPPAPSSDIPSSATASVEGLLAFVSNVIATMTNDTSEPLLVGDAAAFPVSDTTEAAN